MKAVSIKELNSKYSFKEPVFTSINDLNSHLKTMNQLGFTNTGVYLSKTSSGKIIAALQEAGYRVFGEVSPYQDTLVQIEWF